jgi:hypothetical protein
MKIDTGSVILGIVIGVASFALYDYMAWTGGLLHTEPVSEGY